MFVGKPDILLDAIQRFQDVVEDCARAELSRRTATARAQMRPDKWLELLDTQSRWNLLPRLALGHFDLQSIGILADSVRATGTHAPRPLQPILPVAKNPQPVDGVPPGSSGWHARSGTSML